jgi:hypothetical protein
MPPYTFPKEKYHDLTFRPAHFKQTCDVSSGVTFTVSSGKKAIAQVGHPPGGGTDEDALDFFAPLAAGDTITISPTGTVTITINQSPSKRRTKNKSASSRRSSSARPT